MIAIKTTHNGFFEISYRATPYYQDTSNQISSMFKYREAWVILTETQNDFFFSTARQTYTYSIIRQEVSFLLEMITVFKKPKCLKLFKEINPMDIFHWA